MGYFTVRYDSRVVIYERKMFIRLATPRMITGKVLSDWSQQVEAKHIVIVAHEGSVTCIASNDSGTLCLTGGRDGKLCLWQWGKDHFFHQVGNLYLTNLPIICGRFTAPDDSEIVISLDSYVMCMKITKRTSQHYLIEQNPGKHLKMDRTGGKISGPQSLHQLTKIPNAYIVLRTSKLVEIVGPAQDDSMVVDERPVACMCLDHQSDASGNALTSVAYLAHPYNPFVHFWYKPNAGAKGSSKS